jgi:DNA-binding NtrC family response regulator
MWRTSGGWRVSLGDARLCDLMATILLAGEDAALLEGLVQSLVALGHSPSVALSLAEARDTAVRSGAPLMLVIDRGFVDGTGTEVLSVPLAPGGTLVLYRPPGSSAGTLSPPLQRAVLADLTLPLERNRLVALVQHVEERARATGRSPRHTPRETRRA